MVFQQSNACIDRHGQARQPHIAYIYTEPEHPKVRGDLPILELLIEKDEQAAKNIGDPSVFLAVFDAHEEEQMTGKAIEENPLTRRFADTSCEAVTTDGIRSPALFDDDPVHFREGRSGLNPAYDLQADFDPDRQLVTPHHQRRSQQ